MPRRTLSSLPGLPTEIGFYLAGMEEVRGQLREAVAGIADEQFSRPLIPGAHSIAALVLHIGEAEWWWIQSVLSGHPITDTIRNSSFWDVLKDPAGFSQKTFSAEFCLNEITKIRQQTSETLATHADSEFDRVFSYERNGETHELTLRWILHHLIDHEAQHKGQILMLKRMAQEV